ncbi:UPF0481 protein At3g47200-like [Cornus florida]|uniref:UPF0481 protein At3g47200-like n=1 Tax=Cornus florida TaxID=4283 RepID=UPI00289A1405|nr:UPF0481 protein At3g47200-like [Cornus florida]
MANNRNPAAIAQLLEYLKINIDGNKEKIDSLKCYTEHKSIPTIYRVRDELHKMNERAYTPSMVAIGPLHRGKKHLQPMEAEKLSYMHFLFNRTPDFEDTRDACVESMLNMESIARKCYADDVKLPRNFEETRDDCVVAMLKIESIARRCYAEDVKRHEDDKPVKLEYYSKIRDVNCSADQNVMFAENVRFAEMMLVDGCFMIELFYRCYRRQMDPILGNTFKRPTILQDLILIENQLPFDVLEELFRLTVDRIPENRNRPTLTECVLSLYWDLISVEPRTLKKMDDKRTAHVLHLLHSCYLPREEAEEPESFQETAEVLKNFKYSATELDMGGIKFVQGNKKDLFDFKFKTPNSFCFWRRSELEIPPFDVNDYTELFLRNFIALEQSCRVKKYFTSHALLIDRLINTADDVQLLEKKGIIVNNMGSGEEVAHLFNNLGKNISINRLYSTKDCLKVIKFYNQSWPKFQVKLRRDYFSNPWTVISVVAAFFLFVLTLLQTIYTMRS